MNYKIIYNEEKLKEFIKRAPEPQPNLLSNPLIQNHDHSGPKK